MTDWNALFQPWNGDEGDTHPEREHTSWAHPGWLAWNDHAVEVQVADFLARLSQQSSQGQKEWVAIETGVGQGYVTRRMAKAVHPTEIRGIWTFESNMEWNGRIRQLPFWPNTLQSCIKWERTPTPNQMSEADLVVLDSMDPWRKMEILLWSEVGKKGSLLFVHDTGNIHPPHDGHFTNGFLLQQLGIEGLWLENPRGAFLAQKGKPEPEERFKELWGHTLEQVGAFE